MSVRVLVFARAPVAGAAKTRLIPALGADGAAALQAELVRDAVARATAAGVGPVELWGTGDDPAGFLSALAHRHGAGFHWQSGDDLGERMLHALAVATRAGDAALVIGSDCPALDPGAIREAATHLERAPAVLGPAADGGYVLLGLQRIDPRLFRDMPWGADTVLGETRRRLAQGFTTWGEIAERPDVDVPGDLRALAALSADWRDILARIRPQSPASA